VGDRADDPPLLVCTFAFSSFSTAQGVANETFLLRTRVLGCAADLRQVWRVAVAPQPVTLSSTTLCLTAQRVAATRLETPILV
jgi:hypothetical protein